MEWAPQLDFFWSIVEDDGVVPPALANRPPLPDHLRFVWAAFANLSRDRSLSEGRGYIPFAAIDAYARRYGLDHTDEFDRFMALIFALDRAFLEWTPPADG